MNLPPTDLTQSQLLQWIGQQMHLQSPIYNMALSFDLRGNIDPIHFQSAFQILIDQSDALRTTFEILNGKPQQKINIEFPYKMEFLDWSKSEYSESFIQSWLKKRTQNAFDLSKCLFDCLLIKTSEKHYIWYLNQHHLITDAWSVSVIYKKMVELYYLIQEDKTQETSSLPLFRDYVEYEKMARLNPHKQNISNYWEEKLDKLPPLITFYGKKKISPSTKSQRLQLDLGRERSEKLRALTMEKDIRSWTQHLALFNIFSTVLLSYLYKVSSQQKLAIGTPSHNRHTLDFKETIGVFIEIFPILAEVEKGESFGSLFKKIQIETNSFLKYAQPGASTPDLSRRFNVVLNYINATFSDFGDIPMTSNWIHPDHCDPGHHLRLQVHDFDNLGNIQLYFDLNTNVFDDEIQNSVPKHFLFLLDTFIKDRTQKIDAIPIITQQEYKKLVLDFNKKADHNPQSKTISNLFEAQVHLIPENIALEFQSHKLDYSIVNKKANQIAHFLHLKNIGNNNRVAVFLNRSPEYIISVLGIMKSGAAFIPIPANYPKERVVTILEDSQVALFISQKSLIDRLKIPATPTLLTDNFENQLANMPKTNLDVPIQLDATAYIIYTSGSTGKPKGVTISHQALSNYITWAKENYAPDFQPAIPLFTTIGFDLTITSTFLPLISGGKMIIYPETDAQIDLSVLDVIEENRVDFIKLTPSHLALLQGKKLNESRIQTMIVGGEDFKTSLAQNIYQAFARNVTIYNEYGPTEATVGCIVHLFDAKGNIEGSVPIGNPINNMEAYVLDSHQNPVPQGISGELYLAGMNLASGYWNRNNLTEKKFLTNPFHGKSKLYKTGDLVRINQEGILEFLGRTDQQVKITGRRIELREIESIILNYPNIEECVVELLDPPLKTEATVHNCIRCGLPSNYPNLTFDEEGICDLCNAFEGYQQKVKEYFKTEKDLQDIFSKLKLKKKGEYDCIVLLSGGKDSTYALAKIKEMGAMILAFTLDNGYISEQAKNNIRRVVDYLGIDHIFGQTPAMNAIFTDSLHRYSNVCNGCFKTIYTLSIELALEKNIPYIVTGLSRGQFFETRLTEELFRNFDIEKIDETVLEARKAYHRTEDAVNKLLGTTDLFKNEEVFERVQFLDFYRFTDVSMEEMMNYLDTKLPWVRPSDTGRSTNCLINQVGIHVHKTKEGYSNYSFPYSWDVRVGHKTREGALKEINEEINQKEVTRIMGEIGYSELEEIKTQKYLAAFFTSREKIDFNLLQDFLSQKLPGYMIPLRYKELDALPLSPNGKTDREQLRKMEVAPIQTKNAQVPPQTEIEEMITDIWVSVLNTAKIGTNDNFLELGGNSLAAIRINARIFEVLELDIPLNKIFEFPTIKSFSSEIEKIIISILNESERN